jgi:hypothetical protein
MAISVEQNRFMHSIAHALLGPERNQEQRISELVGIVLRRLIILSLQQLPHHIMSNTQAIALILDPRLSFYDATDDVLDDDSDLNVENVSEDRGQGVFSADFVDLHVRGDGQNWQVFPNVFAPYRSALIRCRVLLSSTAVLDVSGFEDTEADAFSKHCMISTINAFSLFIVEARSIFDPRPGILLLRFSLWQSLKTAIFLQAPRSFRRKHAGRGRHCFEVV